MITPLNLALARQYTSAGFGGFWCDDRKQPFAAAGFKSATTDMALLARQALSHPRALFGLPTSAHWVLDLDVDPDGNVTTAVGEMRAAIGADRIPRRCSLVVRTPSGGFHLYFARTVGVAIRNAAGDVGRHVDTRGHDVEGRAKGYTIAPGCRLADGRSYEVVRGRLDDLLAGQLYEAPRELLLLATLDRRARTLINGNPDLRAAIQGADPQNWRRIVDEHREAHLRHRPVLIPASASAMRRQALHDLNVESEALAALVTGRRSEIFRAACRLARYSSNGILIEAEIRGALLSAWQACGGALVHGITYANGAITRALKIGSRDPLPPLSRRFREEAALAA